jgi:hypothetical protein
LEACDCQSRRLVTVIELLSPTNKKPSEDRKTFVGKRRQRLRGQAANYVEIDLLRGWPRMPFVDSTDCDYYALVSRVEERPRVGLWPVRLRDRLPIIPIPLQEPHPDAQLDLQGVLHRVYDAAYYRDYIYSATPYPPLRTEDAEWARQFVPQNA